MALITVKSQTSKKNGAQSRLQKEFDRLTKALEREQRGFKTFQADMERLHQSFLTEIVPALKENSTQLEALAERLIELYGRKSLAKWHREEIDRWLAELFELIGSANPERLEVLAEQYDKVLYQFSSVSKEEAEQHFTEMEERLKQMMDEQFSHMDFDDEADEPDIDDLFGFSDEEKERKKSQKKGRFGDQAYGQDANQAQVSESLTDEVQHQDVDKWLAKLFRKAAQVLHPDREADPEKRAQKQDAMTELLAAREAGDILHILEVYSQHVQQGPAEVPEEMMQALCESLVQKIDQIHDKKLDFLEQNPAMQYVYDVLYDKQKKKQKQNINDALEQAAVLGQMATEDREYMRNLSRLKEMLEERYDARRMDPISVIFDGLL